MWMVFNSELAAWARGGAGCGGKFHAVLCDPPYGLKFMGKDWDVVAAREWGEALLPLLYPGALVLMFGGTRTWHKLAAGMEEAGFGMWDTLMWLHGQGFPKAQDISKLIDKRNGHERPVVATTPTGGYKTVMRTNAEAGFRPVDYYPEGNRFRSQEPIDDSAKPWSGHKTCAFKPAWEPVLCFRAPDGGKTYADLALEYGSSALNVKGGRIGTEVTTTYRNGNSGGEKFGRDERVGCWENPPGRYPANLCLDEEAAALLDAQTGELVSGTAVGGLHRRSPKTANCYGKFNGKQDEGDVCFGDRGGASRFYYTAKASSSERNAGLDEFEASFAPTIGDGIEGKEHNPETATPKRNTHPTVKPLALCRWLATLLLPPPLPGDAPRRLLVPFAGSGSEMIGAVQAGWDEVVGVEQQKDYCDIACARLEHWEAAMDATVPVPVPVEVTP